MAVYARHRVNVWQNLENLAHRRRQNLVWKNDKRNMRIVCMHGRSVEVQRVPKRL